MPKRHSLHPQVLNACLQMPLSHAGVALFRSVSLLTRFIISRHSSMHSTHHSLDPWEKQTNHKGPPPSLCHSRRSKKKHNLTTSPCMMLATTSYCWTPWRVKHKSRSTPPLYFSVRRPRFVTHQVGWRPFCKSPAPLQKARRCCCEHFNVFSVLRMPYKYIGTKHTVSS